MQVKILFNDTALSEKFLVGWGFSCMIGDRILFDAGENEKSLFENMKNMSIDISKIEKVVISHDHYDHTGGLWELLKRKKSLEVYACSHFSESFKEKVNSLGGTLIEKNMFFEISKDIFVTGEIAGVYKGQRMAEQALVLRTNAGITLITGCAHPGIIKMAENVKKEFPEDKFYLVLGGFHLKDGTEADTGTVARNFRQLGIKKLAPTHCTGESAIEVFRKKYGKDFIEAKVGQTINI